MTDREKEKNLKEELTTLIQTITTDKPSQEVVDLFEFFLVRHLKQIIAQSFKRSLRRDPSSNSLCAQDIAFIVKDDPKIMGKIAKNQILHDMNSLYSDNQKTLKAHTKGLQQEVELREGEYDSEEIEDDEKHQ